MHRIGVIATFLVLGTSFSGGQQTTLSAPLQKEDTKPTRVKVYAVGPGVTSPELLPLNSASMPNAECKKKQTESVKVALSFLVDTTGQPRNIMFLHALGTDLDKIALQPVIADRFKPGTHEGVPVVVAESVEVTMPVCVEKKKDDAGKKTSSMRLISQPEQKFSPLLEPQEEAVLTSDMPSSEDFGGITPHIERVGHGVSPPVPLRFPEAEFSEMARKAKYQGVCILSLIVDARGMPQNIKVVRGIGMGLDEKAVEAVGKYRFHPAMKKGTPVPVKLNVEVNFKLY